MCRKGRVDPRRRRSGDGFGGGEASNPDEAAGSETGAFERSLEAPAAAVGEADGDAVGAVLPVSPGSEE